MDAKGRHKTPESVTQDYIAHGTASRMSFRFALVPLDPEVPQE